MLITKHPARSCVYDECNKVLEYKRDTIDHVNTVREYLHSISMPHNYGLYETKCILKLNKNESVINICTNVMNLLLTHSQRDQLLLTPVLFFHNKSHLEYLEPMYITSGKYVNHRLDTPNIRVAVCFWGITRSLKYTHSSIKRYIFSPLTDANIEYDIYLHTYSVDAPYSNLRANEINIKLDNEEYKILNSDYTCVESQDEIDRTLEFEKYRTCGDPWPDSCEFKTLDNHIRALWSLHKVTDMWYENRKKYTHIIYCRPDVEYTKPINTKWFECDINNTIIIPNFQLADDVNDRFAIGTPDTMYVYGNRFTTAYEYSKSNTLHSERYLAHILKSNSIKYIHEDFFFRRVRANGEYCPADKYPIENTAILYVFDVVNESVKYFIKYGIIKASNYTYYLICNNPNMGVDMSGYKNIVFISRENKGFDFGGWGETLLYNDIYKRYSHYIFINSSCIGPFVQPYHKGEWPMIFLNKLSTTIKLVGSTINTCRKPITHSHVQSYCFAMDHECLEYLIQQKIFSNTNYATGALIHNKYHSTPRRDIVIDWEVRMSRLVIEKGWNIGCLMNCYSGIDFRFKDKKPEDYNVEYLDDPCYENAYYGRTLHPYDVIFVKSNRNIKYVL